MQRKIVSDPQNREAVAALLAEVRRDGDAALRRLSARFDGFTPDTFELKSEDFTAAEQALPEALKAAIQQAYANIYRFHERQIEPVEIVETMPGIRCYRKSVAIGKVGLYIPGGTAPLFSTVLMLGIPAQIAGCKEVVLCSPPDKNGALHPAILYAAQLCGIRRVFRLGGVQAIGAMAYGTESVPAVWKIFGPGNPWVTSAKQLVSLEGVAVDLPAGPSEVAILADESANPDFIAADLLSQAEHGADSQVLFVTNTPTLLDAVKQALHQQLADLPRREFAAQALENSQFLLAPDLETGMNWCNDYAAEHLILHLRDAEYWAEKVENAGSVFIGAYSPESAGDYASGTNHTLPTAGYARAYSGVSVDSFVKKITFQQLSPAGLAALAPTISTMARAEGLEAHARAVELRQSGLLF
jgi:histidinol dehydrogenase